MMEKKKKNWCFPSLEMKKRKNKGPTGIRTQVAGIRTLSDNQLHYRTSLATEVESIKI